MTVPAYILLFISSLADDIIILNPELKKIPHSPIHYNIKINSKASPPQGRREKRPRRI